jgi:hypothetical protein
VYWVCVVVVVGVVVGVFRWVTQGISSREGAGPEGSAGLPRLFEGKVFRWVGCTGCVCVCVWGGGGCSGGWHSASAAGRGRA